MNYKLVIPLCLVLSCTNYEDISKKILDITPPKIECIETTSENTLSIVCNEPVSLDINNTIPEDTNIGIKEFESQENSILIKFTRDLKPGVEYIGEFKIADSNGNSLTFISKYYGFNRELPEILINEFIVKGSNTNPNKIELLVTKSGNMAGITLFNGTKNSFDYFFTFPEFYVNKGEYIVVRTISDKYSKPFIEIDDLNINNDSKFIDNVRDLRINNFKLSSTNGVISIYNNPFGQIIDCVVYTQNSNDETKNNRNFGLNKTVIRIDEVGESKSWISENGLIFPSDAINTSDSTTTRSLNRINEQDTDSNSDWKTVATKEATFGFPNSQSYY